MADSKQADSKQASKADKPARTRDVCGDCFFALKPEEVAGVSGYPRIDHLKIEVSRYCRRFPRLAGQDCGIVQVDEPACGEFAQA